MTIRKSADWGRMEVPRSGIVTVTSDSELHGLVERQRGSDPLPVVGLLGGDLMRTVGGSGDAARLAGTEPIPHLPVDVVDVVADGERAGVFVAHLVARDRWWWGPLTAAMNAEFLGAWDVAPRSHPNDGKFDLVRVAADLSVQQRWLARRRVRLGTHVPHPSITVTQKTAATIDLERATSIWLDGVRWGRARHLELTVRPDALTVCV